MSCWTKRKAKHLIVCGIATLAIFHFFGVFAHLLEADYYAAFEYPLDEDITPYVEALRSGERPSREPINGYGKYAFVKAIESKCGGGGERPRLVVLVKSSMGHFERRRAIRSSFGFEHRFSDVPVRTVFVLGVQQENQTGSLQAQVDAEAKKHNDIVQANFVDSYYNNTIKTMVGFEWAMKHCPNSKYYLFSDDDMYVSIKNVLRFVRNPAEYPKYLTRGFAAYKDDLKKKSKRELDAPMDKNCTSPSCLLTRAKRQVQYYELPDDVLLYAGYRFHTSPHRHRTSKWYVSLEEYPYHLWPPYISAGAYVLSKEALATMYFASFFTKHFRFDDIYLGLLAKKTGIIPLHSDDFYFYKKSYSKLDYKYVIASHGYGDPQELLKVWNEQKEAGNA